MALTISSPTLVETDLNKLTARHLRILCKERSIIGVSKLPKAGVISRILDWQKRRLEQSTGSVTSAALQAQASLQTRDEANNDGSATQSDLTLLVHERSHTECSSNVRTPAPGNAIKHPLLQSPVLTRDFLSSGPLNQLNPGSSLQILDKQTKPLVPAVQKVETVATSSKRHCSHLGASAEETVQKKAKIDDKSLTASATTGRRFKALRPKLLVTNAPTGLLPPTEPLDTLSDYLDLVLEGPFPQLQRISFPPSMAQRKHVPRLSLLLSSISIEDLRACALVSRLFRYCAYLAAYNQLLKNFQGSRLTDILSRYPPKVTNFWPYLSYRMNETKKRRGIYETSFVGRTLKGKYDISEDVWTSPDNHKQAIMAIRFLLTKLFFNVSLGHGLESETAQCRSITRVEEVIMGEIWKVTVQSSSLIRIYFVVEATCEVIGEHTEDNAVSLSSDSHCLRPDWKSYIEARICSSSSLLGSGDAPGPLGLLEHLQWTNHEEYAKGISKIWLSKIRNEGDVGMAKLTVAQRYIIACVVSNSISGPRLTANQMLQEFNSIPKTADCGKHPKRQRINLFLPAHHHVESLHFNLSNGKRLHPALAVVQTPSREYYILKDNGMQVGTEEDGVAHVWIVLLGCNPNGSM